MKQHTCRQGRVDPSMHALLMPLARGKWAAKAATQDS